MPSATALRRLAPLLASCLALSACKDRPLPGGDGPGEGGVTVTPEGKRVTLPAPLAIEAEPRALVHVRDPLAAIAALQGLLPGIPEGPAFAETVLATQAPAELAQRLAPMIATRRPWVGVELGGQDILHLPLLAAETAAAEALLAAFPAEGEFGAVRLPGAAIFVRDPELGVGERAAEEGGSGDMSSKFRLAWIDRERHAITFAASLAGVVTGRELGRAYGEGDLSVTLDGARIREYGVEFPYRQITARGAGLHDLRIEVVADPARGLPASPDLTPGALTNLHAAEALALAASTRWGGHGEAVRRIIREMNANLDRAGFAAKMILDSLVQQASAVLRSWNGRVFVGLGPAGHVAIGLGADEPLRAGQGLVRLLGAVIDNLELARMFTVNVPKLALRRHSKEPEIHVLTVQGARGLLPAAARGLIDDKGSLRVAFGFTGHAGAVVAMIGPRAETELAVWAAAISAAPAGAESRGDLLALTVAVGPEQIREVAGLGLTPEAVIQAGLGLAAGRAATQIVVRQEADRYVITARGPAPDVAPRARGDE